MSNPLNNTGLRHLDEGQLLRYLDGELPRRKARQVKQHLEACWQCRAELDELQSAVAECVKYRRQVLGALPAPPEPWQDLSREFDRIDASLAARSIAARLAGLLIAAPVRWAAAGAALIAATIFTFNQLHETPSVQAASLLKRAVVISQSKPQTVRRVRITTAKRQITKVIGAGAAVQPAVSGEAEAAAQLAAMFGEASYNFEDPLSAKSFDDWRNRLAVKQDSVKTDPDAYEIKTATDEGTLVAATLKLRMTDYEPLEGRFEFRNRDWVEMTELVDQQILPASTYAGATGGTPRQPGVPPAFLTPPAEATAPVAGAAGINQELQVVEALHQAGADLGDPIEITREGRRVLVSGIGIPPQRQAELHAVLDRLPDVVVRFDNPSSPNSFPASNPPAPVEPAVTRDAAGPENKQLQARIEERLGGRPQFERFSGQLLDWMDSVMARAYALRRLAQEFPAGNERRMNAADRRALRTLGEDHLGALAAETRKIQTTIVPILTSLGAPAVKGVARPVNDWQPAAEDLLTAARRVESLLATTLGAIPGDASGAEQSPAQLMSGLSQLTASVEQCQRLLSYDDVRQRK